MKSMPWPLVALLAAGLGVLVLRAVIGRRERYDEPMNDWDGRFDHMIEPTSDRDRDRQNRTR